MKLQFQVGIQLSSFAFPSIAYGNSDHADKKPDTLMSKRMLVNGKTEICTFCEICALYRPQRAQHCEKCDACIGKRRNTFILNI